MWFLAFSRLALGASGLYTGRSSCRRETPRDPQCARLFGGVTRGYAFPKHHTGLSFSAAEGPHAQANVSPPRAVDEVILRLRLDIRTYPQLRASMTAAHVVPAACWAMYATHGGGGGTLAGRPRGFGSRRTRSHRTSPQQSLHNSPGPPSRQLPDLQRCFRTCPTPIPPLPRPPGWPPPALRWPGPAASRTPWPIPAPWCSCARRPAHPAAAR